MKPIEDVPEILALVTELAAFEDRSHEFHATEASLRANLCFASTESERRATGRAHAVFLTVVDPEANPPQEVVAGIALYQHTYSFWLAQPAVWLEDLFVRPAFRRGGYATLLLRWLARETFEATDGKGRMAWTCQRWNQAALDFYERIGGKRFDGQVGIRLAGEDLEKLAKEV